MSSPPSRTTRSTRRVFLRTGATAIAGTAALGLVPRPLLASIGGIPEAIPPIDDARLKSLAERAIDAARSVGASYADVRLTHTRERDIAALKSIPRFGDAESISVGVRTLVNGYWGFAASSIWSPDEMDRLARDAVSLSKTNALGKPREMELAPAGQIRDEHWVMPIKTDLFDVYPPDIVDYIRGIGVQLGRLPEASRNIGEGSIRSWRQDKAFASSVGSYYTQRTYRSQGAMTVFCGNLGPVGVETEMAGLGFEVFQDANFVEQLRMKIDWIKSISKLPVKPIDVGRYDTVFDASSVVGVLSGSIGVASELDRALGYEANAGGTSYLGEPLEMLGHFQIGSPLLTVTANRTEPGAVATVRWDDEGIESTSFPIVKDGLFVNYQTNREGSGWLSGHR